MQYMRFRAWLIGAVLLVFCIASMASSPETAISVTVTNQYNKPVENAAVILDFLGSHQIEKLGKRKKIHWEVHTNQEGFAHFPPVPQGTVQVQVIAKAYETFGQNFDLDTREKKIEIKLNPPQKQYSVHPPLKPADPAQQPPQPQQ